MLYSMLQQHKAGKYTDAIERHTLSCSSRKQKNALLLQFANYSAVAVEGKKLLVLLFLTLLRIMLPGSTKMVQVQSALCGYLPG